MIIWFYGVSTFVGLFDAKVSLIFFLQAIIEFQETINDNLLQKLKASINHS